MNDKIKFTIWYGRLCTSTQQNAVVSRDLHYVRPYATVGNRLGLVHARAYVYMHVCSIYGIILTTILRILRRPELMIRSFSPRMWIQIKLLYLDMSSIAIKHLCAKRCYIILFHVVHLKRLFLSFYKTLNYYKTSFQENGFM